jgi:AcrR family transcriptional regulator
MSALTSLICARFQVVGWAGAPGDTVSTGPATAAGATPKGRRRRDEILELAVRMIATHSYHGVTMDDIGAAAGVTGPALYHHFAGKEAMLEAALVPVSERLRDGGAERVAAARDPASAIAALVDFHLDFSLANPAVITLHLHELDRLPEEPRRRIRRLQRQYIEEWVQQLVQARPGLDPDSARVLCHGVFGLLNSTPFLREPLTEDRVRELLRHAALAALLGG